MIGINALIKYLKTQTVEIMKTIQDIKVEFNKEKY